MVKQCKHLDERTQSLVFFYRNFVRVREHVPHPASIRWLSIVLLSFDMCRTPPGRTSMHTPQSLAPLRLENLFECGIGRQVGSEAQSFAYERMCRTPPKKAKVKPAPFKEILDLIGRPDLTVERLRKSVQRYKTVRTTRGRPIGWRKTTPRDDKQIVAAFHRARKPLGSLCETRDVWKACPRSVRAKVHNPSSVS